MYKTQTRSRFISYGRWVASPAELLADLERAGTAVAWEPPTDVYSLGDRLIIRMELAGIEPEAIELLVDGRRLRITGQRSRPACYEGHCQFSQAEISYGPFVRAFEFPESLEQAELRASCADGFLTIEVRPATVGPRRIAVEHAE